MVVPFVITYGSGEEIVGGGPNSLGGDEDGGGAGGFMAGFESVF